MRLVKDLDGHVQDVVHCVTKFTGRESGGLLAGPIIPDWLPAAMPIMPKSESSRNGESPSRRNHLDMIALLLLCEVISAYRARNGTVFFRGPAYRIKREHLASRFGCTNETITRVTTFLEKEELILVKRTAIRRDDRYAGNAVYAIPNIEKIVALIAEARKVECSLPAFRSQ